MKKTIIITLLLIIVIGALVFLLAQRGAEYGQNSSPSVRIGGSNYKEATDSILTIKNDLGIKIPLNQDQKTLIYRETPGVNGEIFFTTKELAQFLADEASTCQGDTSYVAKVKEIAEFQEASNTQETARYSVPIKNSNKFLWVETIYATCLSGRYPIEIEEKFNTLFNEASAIFGDAIKNAEAL